MQCSSWHVRKLERHWWCFLWPATCRYSSNKFHCLSLGVKSPQWTLRDQNLISGHLGHFGWDNMKFLKIVHQIYKNFRLWPLINVANATKIRNLEYWTYFIFSCLLPVIQYRKHSMIVWTLMPDCWNICVTYFSITLVWKSKSKKIFQWKKDFT